MKRKNKIITSSLALLFTGVIATISIAACSKQNNQKTKNFNSQEQQIRLLRLY